MYVGTVMHKDLVTISPNASLIMAKKEIEKRKIEHLLVVDDKEELVGLVTDSDVKRFWASPATTLSAHELNYVLEKVTIDMVMVKNIISIHPEETIERAGKIMQEHEIHSLPVMEDNKLVGIVTTTDVMQVLLQAIGISDESKRLTLLVEDRVGFLAKISSSLGNQNINIESLVSWPDQQYAKLYQIVVRISARDGERAIKALEDDGFKVMTKYIKDLKPYLPENYQ